MLISNCSLNKHWKHLPMQEPHKFPGGRRGERGKERGGEGKREGVEREERVERKEGVEREERVERKEGVEREEEGVEKGEEGWG